jgi:hypothetical protein
MAVMHRLPAFVRPAWAVVCLVAAAASAQVPATPAAATPPTAGPHRPYAEAVAARFPPPPVSYATPGLLPGRSHWTDNAEMAAALRTLAGAGAAQLLDQGRTEAGGELLALRFSRGAGRPVALLVGQQHGNEPAGGEALLALAMQLANPAHPLSSVLDRLDVVMLPRANPDGSALGRRVNAAGLDINRDHLLLRTREAQAAAGLVAQFRPALFVDVHEHIALGRYMPKFGGIKGHDLLIQYATTPNLPPALTELAEQGFRQPLLSALDAAGISHEWYYTNPRDPQDLLLTMGGVQPGLARNAGGLKNMVSVLLESRGFDLGRLHAQRRVHSQVVALDSLLRSAAAQADALPRRMDAIGREVAALACSGTLVLDAAPTRRRREFTLIDPDTGADKRLEVDWDDALQLQPQATRARPCGYWLAADATEAVARLRLLGVEVQGLPSARPLSVERYRETARVAGERRDTLGRVDDGQPVQRITVVLEPGVLDPGPGSFYVPLSQPLAHLVAAALEPDTADSWFAHRLLPRLDAVQRVMAPP